MSMMARRQSPAELMWVRRIGWGGGDTEHWHLRSPSRELCLWLDPQTMRGVCAEGQLMLLELDLQKGPHAVSHPVIIAGIEDKALVERHFTWLPAGREYILRDIWGMLGHLPDPALRQFYHMVLADDGIMAPLFKARASHRHHHDHVGGLLEHSHEVATTAATLCLQHKVGPLSTCVAFVGGLLHDIGKIHLYYNAEDGEGICGQHESYNFLVLARQMEALRMAAPRLFEALSSCLSIKIGGRVDAYLPASMVRMCDRLSVEVSNWRRAFADAPAYYWYAKSPGDAQLYKRLG